MTEENTLSLEDSAEEILKDNDIQVVIEEQAPMDDRMRKTLAVLAVILIILLLLGCALLAALLGSKGKAGADTGDVDWIRSIYGFGNRPEDLISPASVAFQPGSSDLWTTDANARRVVRFNWNGNLKEVIYADADGETLKFPTRIAVARNGDLWITETTYSRVLVLDKNLNRIATLTVSRPHSVAVNDEVAIVGTTGGFVVFDRKGEVLGYLGERGKGEENFDTVNGVWLDDGNNAYVVDTFNTRLSKYDPEGELLWKVGLGLPMNSGGGEGDIGKAGRPSDDFPAGMQMPMGICMDDAGRLLIVDTLDFTIAAFDPEDGSFIDKWGVYGEENGQFGYSSDIAYDPRTDSFLVADNGNKRLQVISLPGSSGGLGGLGRLLNGPLAACLIPLLLLILFAIMVAIWRFLKKKREEALAEQQKDNVLSQVEELIER